MVLVRYSGLVFNALKNMPGHETYHGRCCMFPYNDDDLIKWYHGYKNRKAQKVSIKEELLPITWHPSRWWNWCIPDDDKKETEKLFLTI